MSAPPASPIVLAAPGAPPPPGGMTVEEFVHRYPEGTTELVNGVVKEYPVAGLNHGKLCIRIGSLILGHVDAHDLGQVMSNDSRVRTGPDSVRGADVMYYSYERLPRNEPVPEGMHALAPDLVVEVKSPSDLWTDLFAKVVEYLRAGVRVVVLVDPGTTTVSLYRGSGQVILHAGDELTLPDVLPGFAVPVARLFA